MAGRTQKVAEMEPDLDRDTAEDLASHNRPAGTGDVPVLHTVAPGFVRVLRSEDGRPEVVHTPGELLPPEVASALSTGTATAGADGVILVDLR